ncbi:MAG: universal stress protein [Amaricoccus sp.]|uniref:universal stress protein n=1 Tax=Amaricoccus sp. TaxID=1872485 RepID=UPI003315107B
MSFKTVFFTIGTDQDTADLDRVAAVCGELGAHLTVLVLGVAAPPPASPYGVISNDVWAGEIDQGQDAARAKAAEVTGILEKSGISFEVNPQFVDRATVTTLAARFARYADITFVAPHAARAETQQDWVMNGALFESGRPVLLLPGTPFVFPPKGRVVLAWDASVEASKAVRDSIDLLARAASVDAVLIDPVPSFDGHGPEPGADLAAYLARHGVVTTIHRLPREGQEVGDILRRTATDLGADLIVMGGFGHSRLRQRFFGGTTSTMMKQVTIPVLMAH